MKIISQPAPREQVTRFDNFLAITLGTFIGIVAVFGNFAICLIEKAVEIMTSPRIKLVATVFSRIVRNVWLKFRIFLCHAFYPALAHSMRRKYRYSPRYSLLALASMIIGLSSLGFTVTGYILFHIGETLIQVYSGAGCVLLGLTVYLCGWIVYCYAHTSFNNRLAAFLAKRQSAQNLVQN